ncbi:MAG TPA: CDP-glucose 4,6-dehydratase [Xanthobacteraceae bacterium]|nr:CDP-glucose 4,6-dehydratase [Xanthobacteraceae bacterium]
MGLDRDFWEGKRVLLTGHTGFKGAWLTLWLAKIGARVTGYSLDPPSEPNLFNVARVRDSLVKHHHADILDLQKIQAAVVETAPEVIFHMAAQSLVRASYHEPVYTYAVNVMGTAHVLEAARLATSVQAVVVITSDKCYENLESGHPYRESDRLGGNDPYSASKACAELVTASYRTSFASKAGPPLRFASARAGNVIGGGDWAVDRLVPDCVRAFAERKPVLLRYPEAVRPWQHALDPLFGYLQLVQALLSDHPDRYATAWNFGPDASSEATVGDVAASVARQWGSGAQVRIDRAAASHREAEMLRLDSSKARAELGWRPRWPLERSLQETVRWYRAWQDGLDMRRFSTEQIEAYLQDAA